MTAAPAPAGLKERLGRKFDEEIRFFKGWMDGPKSVGAICPTSSITAKRMASVINPSSGLPVLELGPGTGVITKAIRTTGDLKQRFLESLSHPLYLMISMSWVVQKG